MYQVRTYNKISDKGLSLFPAGRYSVAEDVSSPEAILLRSHKLHGETLPESVIAVARAGAGTNNVPVDEYTKSGVVVFNTPGANANAVKELVLAGMLLSSRGILQGRDYVATLGDMTDKGEMSKLLEAEKKRFAGSELAGKKLGIVGLGAIGSMVANAALALGMDVYGFDPALSVEAAWRLPSDVHRMESLQALLSEIDYLTLHVPAIDATKNMINRDTLGFMKPSAAIMNFARDAIVDSEAVVEALDAGKLRNYVCDFPEPCLIGHEKVIAVPHIGASTAEAEENCAVMAVNQLRDYLENGNIKNSVNFPETSMGGLVSGCRITFTNQNVSGVLGNVLSVFAENNVNVIDMMNKSRNDVAYNILDIDTCPSDAVLAALKSVEHVISLRVIVRD
ncbi:D-isomer specific 2-hydroxyacid dehydrogenase, catalytic domain protein [Teredinibacter turnerae T7901]|uniref:D-3-phosphoglycerate dehydrogenase n=1 Tax=Teredinibacter turnerae (strain ATCC 39867 / T7901) TaxID=377629 RepID=C5BMJ8_TERTT|nr:phosphoglycerate dehydrogenase [Teredinibacter turnerae]ACR11907.1 D-isomer specific 2-hydroxyacid dehydrogenase, catalytic domain protein [Teredinibacter turnerae T7901]